jgi:hypothetical protein
MSYTMKIRHVLPTLGFVLTALATTKVQAYITYFGELPRASNAIPTYSTFATQHSPSVFEAKDAFLSNDQSVTTCTTCSENFESFKNGDAGTLNLSFPGNGITAQLTGNGVVSDSNIATHTGLYSSPGDLNGPITGTKYYETEPVGSSAMGTFTLTFSQAVGAFGFFGTDIGDYGGHAVLDVFSGNTKLASFTTNNSTSTNGGLTGSALFFGFVANVPSELFTKITFSSSLMGNGDNFGYDDLTVLTAGQVGLPEPTVPEPGTIALVGAALLGASLARRRRA